MGSRARCLELTASLLQKLPFPTKDALLGMGQGAISPSALHRAQGIPQCESPLANAWVTPPDESPLPLGDPGSFVPCKGPIPGPMALGSCSHDALVAWSLLLTEAFLHVWGEERKWGGGAAWFRCGGQHKPHLPSLLGKRLPKTPRVGTGGFGGCPHWEPAHGTGVPLCQHLC